jgi:energy-coupling factor transporter ATP-binding protein EcfA2
MRVSAEGGLRHNDRVFVCGQSGSGKSELLNLFFSLLGNQRLLLDTKPEFRIPDVDPVSDPAEIDWTQKTIHYVPTVTGGLEEIDELFERALRRRNLTIVCHEISDLCEFQPGRTPKWVNGYISKGSVRGDGFYSGSQRPVQGVSRARTESNQTFYVVPRLVKKTDHSAMAEPMGMDPDTLATSLDTTQAEHGRHSYLWWDARARELQAFPPLPEQLRSRIVVERAEDA